MEQGITTTQKTLLSLLANALFSCDREIDESVDYISVWKEAYAQAVPMLPFSVVDAEKLSETLHKEIAFKSRVFITKSMRVDAAHAELNNLLENAAIPYTVLKGYASAKYYPDYIMRAMGDVDFLIGEEHLEKASEILISQGYEMSHENHDYHRVFQKGAIRLEMHFEPSGVPEGEKGDIIRDYLKDAIDKSLCVKTDFGNVCVPSDFHHGLIILMHTAHHMTSGGIGLRQLCDWAVFVSSLSDEAFVSLFEEKLRKAGLWHFACVITNVCRKYLGCPGCEWAGREDEELCLEIINDIFNAGNFGQKDEKRSQESLLISGGKKKKKSLLSQLFASMNSIVYQKWGITRKLKFLLPIGWLFFGGRYIVRMLMGKRPKIHAVEARNEAKERMEIYDKLNLYEMDEGR